MRRTTPRWAHVAPFALFALAACAATSTPTRRPAEAAAAEAAAMPANEAHAGSAAALCVVLRSYAPVSMWWAIHGCAPDPAPVPEALRPCRVRWGPDTVTLGYDHAGRLLTVDAAPALTTCYAYDASGLASIRWSGTAVVAGTIVVHHDGGAVSYAEPGWTHPQRFALAGNHLASLDDGHTTWEWIYSGDRLLEARSRDLETTVRFSYDGRGLLAGHDDGHEAWTYTWDAEGRIVAIGGWDHPVTVEYCE